EWLRGRPGRFFVRPREGPVPGGLGAPFATFATSPQVVEAVEDVIAHQGQGLPQRHPSVRPADLPPASCSAVLDVETFAAMRHVTLHWAGDTEWVRPEVEAELGKALAQVYSG